MWKIIQKAWRRYREAHLENKITKKDCCSECIHLKDAESNLCFYGEKTTLLVKEVQEKIKQTNIELYGCERAIESEIIKQKSKKTLQKRYGVNSPFAIPEVQNRIKKIFLEKYGVDNVLKLKEIREKIKKTNLERYGVENVWENGPIKNKALEKTAITKSLSSTVPTSKAQEYLNLLYGSESNKAIKYYTVDGLFEKEKIYFEYDGTGHNLSVSKKLFTQEEFDKRALNRYHCINNLGYKMFKIINENPKNRDKLPDDKILLQMKDIAFELFNKTENRYIHYNIDKNIIHIKNKDINWDYKSLLSQEKIFQLLETT